MTSEQLTTIEKKLNITLPYFYKITMQAYPFTKDDFWADIMLPNNVERVIDCSGVFTGKDKCFSIGSDGSEYLYFIKLNGEEKVYVFDLEKTSEHLTVFTNSWSEYIKRIDLFDAELEEEEKQCQAERRKRKNNKSWWQFWI